jgi:hypothetical protein
MGLFSRRKGPALNEQNVHEAIDRIEKNYVQAIEVGATRLVPDKSVDDRPVCFEVGTFLLFRVDHFMSAKNIQLDFRKPLYDIFDSHVRSMNCCSDPVAMIDARMQMYAKILNSIGGLNSQSTFHLYTTFLGLVKRVVTINDLFEWNNQEKENGPDPEVDLIMLHREALPFEGEVVLDLIQKFGQELRFLNQI